MATKHKGKTIPCEGCRERKKKCTAGQPCERCKRLGIQCYYLKPVAPPKLEYIEAANNQEIQHHVEVLEDIIRAMEREMYLLKSPFLIKQDDPKKNSAVMSTNSVSDSAFSDEDFDTNFHINNHHSLIKQSNNITNWQLKIGKKGEFTINTDIESYSTLLKHIEALGTTSTFFPIVKQPTLASLSAGGGYLYRHVLNCTLRKGRFKTVVASIQNIQQRQSRLMIEAPPSPPISVSEHGNLALRLVESYFSCRFLHRVMFHQKTFFDMFVNRRSNPESSPVVCALSAAVLTMHCKHVIAIVPYNQQMSLGEYYFNKARHAISLQFDEPSMETMIAYLHMSLYKIHLLQPQEANMYLEMAIRIRQILLEDVYKYPPTYTNNTTNITNATLNHNNTNTVSSSSTITTNENTSPTTTTTTTRRVVISKVQSQYMGEYETFKRLHAGFQDVIQSIQFVNNKRGVPVKNTSNNNDRNKPSMYNKGNEPFGRLFQSIHTEVYDPKPMPDESRQMVRAIMKEHYIGCIAKIVSPYFARVRFGEENLVPLSFLLKTEADLHQVYSQHIPLDYQLAPSIFEDELGDQEFKKRMKEDGRCDVVSVTLAVRYYQSLLALHESFLPVIKRPGTIIDLSLLQETDTTIDKTRKKKRKRKLKEYCSPGKSLLSNTTSSSSSSEEDTDDYDDSAILSVHVLRAQDVCYKCAIIVVRLLEYQCTVLGACTIPVPTLLCAWDILMRNSCLGMTQDDLDEAGVSSYLTSNDIQIARKYAVRCCEVLRRGHMYNGAEREIWEYHEKIETQLLNALGTAAPSTAKYWEPVDTW